MPLDPPRGLGLWPLGLCICRLLYHQNPPTSKLNETPVGGVLLKERLFEGGGGELSLKFMVILPKSRWEKEPCLKLALWTSPNYDILAGKSFS